MAKDIVWLDEAKVTYLQNLDYLEKEWDIKVINNFIYRVEELIRNISQDPEMYMLYDKKRSIHKCVLLKAITLYYMIKEDRIYLLTFWNNYQDPKRLEF